MILNVGLLEAYHCSSPGNFITQEYLKTLITAFTDLHDKLEHKNHVTLKELINLCSKLSEIKYPCSPQSVVLLNAVNSLLSGLATRVKLPMIVPGKLIRARMQPQVIHSQLKVQNWRLKMIENDSKTCNMNDKYLFKALLIASRLHPAESTQINAGVLAVLQNRNNLKHDMWGNPYSLTAQAIQEVMKLTDVVSYSPASTSPELDFNSAIAPIMKNLRKYANGKHDDQKKKAVGQAIKDLARLQRDTETPPRVLLAKSLKILFTLQDDHTHICLTQAISEGRLGKILFSARGGIGSLHTQYQKIVSTSSPVADLTRKEHMYIGQCQALLDEDDLVELGKQYNRNLRNLTEEDRQYLKHALGESGIKDPKGAAEGATEAPPLPPASCGQTFFPTDGIDPSKVKMSLGI